MYQTELAIVIPAYKIDFFEQTLASIANQTCKNFNLYIGIDNSPFDFETIIKKFSSKISINYYRFSDNLGSMDLVGQWTRCINLISNEKWIWLFSDDDVIGEKCVEIFYKELQTENNLYDIFHFDVKIINEKGMVIKSPRKYPKVITSIDLYKMKSLGKIDCFVVENIFSREIYDKYGGFKSLPLAWGSDLATWIEMSLDNGLITIKEDYVYWRQSNLNITPNKSTIVIKNKLFSEVELLSWTNTLWYDKIKYFNQKVLLRILFHYIQFIDKELFYYILKESKKKSVINRYSELIIYNSYFIIKFLKIIRLRYKLFMSSNWIERERDLTKP
jgi:hypothetical protein